MSLVRPNRSDESARDITNNIGGHMDKKLLRRVSTRSRSGAPVLHSGNHAVAAGPFAWE
ncbi:hypothetical protein GCM10009603_03780 [Nocardiopsis exhalans]